MLRSFWAYILSIYYARSERWELRSAVSVGIACLGVLIMTYGDSGSSPSSEAAIEASASASAVEVGGNTQGSLLGDLLGLLSSLACGFYEVGLGLDRVPFYKAATDAVITSAQPGLVQAVHRSTNRHL